MKVRPLPTLAIVSAIAAPWLFSGCTTPVTPEEKQARDEVSRLGSALQPTDGKRALPQLTAESSVEDYLRYAVLNHPQVSAAYFDWKATVLAIAPTRALPDPKLTFEADITDTLMTFMPGLMFDFMTPGKRRAMATEATAVGNMSYRTYVSTVLRVAAETRKSWIELAYIDEALRLRESSLKALEQSLELANNEYATGRGMGTLVDQVRAANDIARVRSELATLGDRRTAVLARFKASLGLKISDPDPVWPRPSLAPTTLPGEEELWRQVLAANADLAQMRAMVDMATAGIEVARKAGTPDFAVGVMADLKADPLMVRPTASVTLPVWREKIAANIAAATARRDASAARVTAEQISMAAEFAQMLYMVRESDRMIAFIDQTALPSFDRTIASVEASYQSGMGSPAMIPETKLMALTMRLERLSALRDRELAVTDLSLMTAAIAPAGAPLIATENPSSPL